MKGFIKILKKLAHRLLMRVEISEELAGATM